MFVFFSFKVFLSFFTGLWFIFSLIAQPVEALVKTENQKLFDEALIASKNGSSYDALEKWNKVYRTYAIEVIEMAIKKPFSLLETVEKSVRSTIS